MEEKKNIWGEGAQNSMPLFYHLQNEKTIAAIHYLYKKMLEHWNSEIGYRTTPNGS